jgi:outer membrane protein TolC
MNVRPLLAMLAALELVGCAGFSTDGGFDAVADAAHTRLAKDLEWPRTDDEQAKVRRRVDDLLAAPLGADDAVQIALLNNRMLQADFEELGISEADLVQSGRLPNPRFDLRHAAAGGQYDIEETLTFNILSLFTMGYARDIEKRRFAQTQNAVVLRVIQLAKDTREAFVAAVAAQDSVAYLRRVNAVAETGAQLSNRMVTAGNWNRLDQSRERVFYIDAVQSLTRARLHEDAAREKLIRLMGLAGSQTGAGPAVQLATHLPELPAGIDNPPDVETAVLQNRLDLRLMRLQVDELAHRLKLTRATRFINVLDVGPTRVRQGTREDSYVTGYALSFEVPIFDSGGARIRKSEAVYAQAVDRFAQAAVDARSEIRQAYGNYRAAFDLARQLRDEATPLQKAVAEQNLLRYNASLISVFELLADAREQVLGADRYIQSVRDFWIAKTEFDAALLGSTPL